MTKKLKYDNDQLVSLLQAKDGKAFTYLYENYSEAIYGLICKVLNDDELSNDCMQEVFVKIWKNFESYNPQKGRLFTWMLNIARNSAIDKLRANKNFSKNQSISDSVYVVDREHNTNKSYDTIGLKDAVSKLKPEQKEVIELAYFSGYTQDEISKELNLPLGTVKTRNRMALQELKKFFSCFF